MANANVARGSFPIASNWGQKLQRLGFNIYFVPSSTRRLSSSAIPSICLGLERCQRHSRRSARHCRFSHPRRRRRHRRRRRAAIIRVTRDLPVYHPASTAQYIAVSDDPNLLYMVQDDASSQATAPNSGPARTPTSFRVSGSTVTGYSGWQLAASTVATTNTLDVKIMRPLQQATTPSARREHQHERKMACEAE
jgi:hypothetical protein